ncbi:glucose dehydrogenase [FAD, quinone]-like [Periplaneta americana]|uniref:glucose dehydrogenase [FAD, quinone]-like n=1 Tax=Periplaneta americana TaxID=6978 RepID=UPI0037E9267E
MNLQEYTIILLPLLFSRICGFIRSDKGLAESILDFIGKGTEYREEEPPDAATILPEYDFIIVGAGAAGSVVANRLSEISEWDILLLEAGGSENFVMDIPLMASLFQFTETNWKYSSIPNNNVCLGMEEKRCLYPRGKVMGGSTTINYMVYTRGNRRNYDEWEKMGNSGWGYKDVLPYFLKLENMTIPELAADKYHSTTGELRVSYAPYRTQLAAAFLKAGSELGYNIVDYNGETQTGFAYLQSTTANGTRWSASRAFLHPIKNRNNLHVKKRSLVCKVLIYPNTRTAYGVEFIRDNKKYTVRARKEVILSAGAINSPQILMLSGIGPRKHLEQLNIPVIQDLPVGYNLMDHPAIPSASFLINQTVALVTNDLISDRNNLIDFMSYHRGPFTIPGAGEGIAFFDTKDPQNPDGNSNLELFYLSAAIPSDISYYKMLGYSNELYNYVFKQIEGNHSFSLIPIVMQPKSRGRVFLQSSDPQQKPLIDYNFLEHSEDMETLLYGIKLMLKVSKTSGFQKFGSRLHDVPVPGCENLLFGSDDYWRCYARQLAAVVWHVSGTCKMGPLWDSGSVVDSKLNVYGVRGLRVIDASIMPMIPAAHTATPTMMIGEKGADLVKDYWVY